MTLAPSLRKLVLTAHVVLSIAWVGAVYWIAVKLLLTIPAVWLMLMHVRAVQYAARVASAATFVGADPAERRLQLIAYAGVALAVLLTATVLSTYKPRGRTAYGERKLARRG